MAGRSAQGAAGQGSAVGRSSGNIAVIVVAVHHGRLADLAQQVDAAGVAGAFAGRRQRWQQHRRQNGDDRDHDQEFNERKTFFHGNLILCYNEKILQESHFRNQNFFPIFKPPPV
ncbi:hypothetical protein SDC9_202694 [bioreactor metagenome]|uniref:Uncharacterized protein n=1 Tax=bioreactor metagenome TaxID=1076179 RepID=A0A645IUB6_9ZZZZ